MYVKKEYSTPDLNMKNSFYSLKQIIRHAFYQFYQYKSIDKSTPLEYT